METDSPLLSLKALNRYNHADKDMIRECRWFSGCWDCICQLSILLC